MLSKQGFDLWADDYDKNVQEIEDNNEYPFAGYKRVLSTIYNEVMHKPHSSILDIGFGTGVLTTKLYENGHNITGIDFSSRMISIAQEKMPQANLLEWDITNGIPLQIVNNKFDFIISTYALHHLTDKEKFSFVKKLLNLLTDEGRILIGDISFQNRKKLDKCRLDYIEQWDDDEFYFIFDEFQKGLSDSCNLTFLPISHCAGVIIISKL